MGKRQRELKEKVKTILSNDNCKKILSWTEETRKDIINEFPEIKNKIDVVYPAIPEKKINRQKKKEINLIFSGRYFYWKGGLHALEVIDRLTKKYPNVYGIVNSEIPEEIKNKYSNNKKINFYGLIPQNKLFELYQKADIMIYPGYSDTFGFAYLESMSFGIPVITVDGFARREIIEEGKTGFIVEKNREINNKEFDEEIINLLTKKASELIDNKKLREKMSKNCIEIIKNGKFSIKQRNSQLRLIYEEAIK